MTQEFKRSDRVGSAIQRGLSELIPKLKATPPGLVTIQEARVTRDLSQAKVYFTVLGAEPEETLEALEHAAGHLRRELGRSMKLRSVPELHFVYDTSIGEGARLQSLIEDAVASDKNRDEDS